MANPADRFAQKTFGQLESTISGMYKEASKDVGQKMKTFTQRHRAKDKQMQRDLKMGKITPEQYANWMKGQVFIGQQWKDQIASINGTIKNVMGEASEIIHSGSIGVFIDNANYTAFQMEKDYNGGINFSLYDRTTVSRLIKEDPELLPRKVVDGKKLEAWNTKIISNCVAQGILQGESIDEISNRIARDTGIEAGKSSRLYARTAMTGAQNAGRVERMKEAEEMGIKVQKQWMATLDSRTRDTHASLDGEIVDVDDDFSNGLEYPGDFRGDPAEVYNCRCTLVYHYPEYSDPSRMERTAYYEEGDPEYDPDHRNYETVKGMNYEQWTNYKQDQIRQRHGGLVESITNPYSGIPEVSWGTYSEGLPNNITRQIEKEIMLKKGDMTINEYWQSLVNGTNKNTEIEELLKQLSSEQSHTPEIEIPKDVSPKDKTPEELVKELKPVDINEDWLYQPEPEQEKYTRENLIPFVGVGKDVELDEKLDFDFSTKVVSTQDNVPVRISDLKTLQPTVDTRGVERALRGQAGMGSPVKVVEYNGQMYVLDGNHRVNAAILRGEKTIKVKLIKRRDK